MANDQSIFVLNVHRMLNILHQIYDLTTDLHEKLNAF